MAHGSQHRTHWIRLGSGQNYLPRVTQVGLASSFVLFILAMWSGLGWKHTQMTGLGWVWAFFPPGNIFCKWHLLNLWPASDCYHVNINDPNEKQVTGLNTPYKCVQLASLFSAIRYYKAQKVILQNLNLVQRSCYCTTTQHPEWRMLPCFKFVSNIILTRCLQDKQIAHSAGLRLLCRSETKVYWQILTQKWMRRKKSQYKIPAIQRINTTRKTQLRQGCCISLWHSLDQGLYPFNINWGSCMCVQ